VSPRQTDKARLRKGFSRGDKANRSQLIAFSPHAGGWKNLFGEWNNPSVVPTGDPVIALPTCMNIACIDFHSTPLHLSIPEYPRLTSVHCCYQCFLRITDLDYVPLQSAHFEHPQLHHHPSGILLPPPAVCLLRNHNHNHHTKSQLWPTPTHPVVATLFHPYPTVITPYPTAQRVTPTIPFPQTRLSRTRSAECHHD
jgi:hypothetical protein